jgi:hypothetical protein
MLLIVRAEYLKRRQIEGLFFFFFLFCFICLARGESERELVIFCKNDSFVAKGKG